MAETKKNKVSLTYNKSDKTLDDWVKNQENLSLSIRTLIKSAIQQYGTVDYADVLINQALSQTSIAPLVVTPEPVAVPNNVPTVHSEPIVEPVIPVVDSESSLVEPTDPSESASENTENTANRSHRARANKLSDSFKD